MLQQAILPKRQCRLERFFVWNLGVSDYLKRERSFLQCTVFFILSLAPGVGCWLVGCFLCFSFFKRNEF